MFAPTALKIGPELIDRAKVGRVRGQVGQVAAVV
jgi:hypothetical protein